MRRQSHQVKCKYRAIRVALMGHGLTLRSWAAANGYPASTVYDAARGERHGRTSQRIREQLSALIDA